MDQSKFEHPPAKCKKGGAKIRINCDDNGNFKPKQAEGLEHLAALHKVALQAKDVHTMEMVVQQYHAIVAAMEA